MEALTKAATAAGRLRMVSAMRDNRVAVGRVAPVAERIDIERLSAFGDGERLQVT